MEVLTPESMHGAQQATMHLLAEFLKPREISKAAKWLPPAVAEQAVAHFIKEGSLVKSAINDRMSAAYTAAELKKMLADRDLPVSGTKAVLIRRLIDAGAAPQEAGAGVYVCSDEVRAAVESWEAQELAETERASDEVIAFLRQRDVDAALRVVEGHKKAHPTTHDIMAEWRPNALALSDPPARTAADVLALLSITPGLLKSLDQADLERARIAAALSRLSFAGPAYRKALSGFVGTARFSAQRAVSIIQAGARCLDDIKQWSASGMKSARVVVSTGCSVCSAFNDKTFRLASMPEFPRPDCLEVGCTAVLVPDASWDDRRGRTQGSSLVGRLIAWAFALAALALLGLWMTHSG